MSYLLRQTLGLESAEIFSPSTVIIEQTEVSSEVELVSEVQEMEATSGVILAASSDIDKVETSVATLESVLLTLEVSMENHSLNNINVAMAYVTLEHIEQSLGLESGRLTVALESETEGEGDQTWSHAKSAASGMWGKIKSMLSQLKDAGAKLFSKIVEQYHIFIKDVANIAARVKQRINTLKSNIDMSNKGGEPLKVKSLRQLTGAMNNGKIDGASFMKALSTTKAQADTMANSLNRDDPLSAVVNGLKIGNLTGGGMSIKQLASFGKHINEVAKHKLNTDANAEREAYGSDIFMNGKQLIVTRFSEAKFAALLKFVVENSIEFEDVYSMESEMEETTEETGEAAPEKTSKIKAFKEKFAAKIKSLGITKAAALSALIALCAIAGGGVSLYYVLSSLFISTAEIIICTTAAIVLGGVSVAAGRKTIKALAGNNTEVVEQLEDTIGLESRTISMEAGANLNDTVQALQIVTAEFKIVDVDKPVKDVSVVSMSGKDIRGACDVLSNIADSLSSIAVNSKNRKKSIDEYAKLAKKQEDYYNDDAKANRASGRDTVRYIKNLIDIEVDYCKNMSNVLLGGIAYLEASNNAGGKANTAE